MDAGTREFRLRCSAGADGGCRLKARDGAKRTPEVLPVVSRVFPPGASRPLNLLEAAVRHFNFRPPSVDRKPTVMRTAAEFPGLNRPVARAASGQRSEARALRGLRPLRWGRAIGGLRRLELVAMVRVL